jgi:hypothetical protein
MLTLTGTVRAITTLGGGKRKTGETIPERRVLQLEGKDSRGLFQLFTLAVPDPDAYAIGEVIQVPVRAWASGAPVNLSYEASK